MTLGEFAKKHGLSLKVEGGQYRINYKGGREHTAYYTYDEDRARNVIRQMGELQKKGRKL